MSDKRAVSMLLALPLAGLLATGPVGRWLGVRTWVIAVPLIVVTSLVDLVVIARALPGSFAIGVAVGIPPERGPIATPSGLRSASSR